MSAFQDKHLHFELNIYVALTITELYYVIFVVLLMHNA
jgi:hypothetical protein